MSNRAVRRAGTIVVASLAAIAVTGVALAAGGLKAAKQTTPMTEEITRAKAKCAGDRDAISGGYRTKDEPGVLLIASSRPAGNDRWKAAIDGDSSPDPGDAFSAYAYCREQNVSTKVKRVTVSPGAEGGRAKAKCPDGTKALSGGFSTAAGESPLPSDSRRAGKRGWKVNAAMFDDEARTLKAYAICGKGSLRTAKKVRTISPGPGDYQRFEVEAKCKQGERVVSGGFAADEPLNKGGPFFDASYRSGPREWAVAVIATFIEPEITAYAYCEKV